MHRFHHPEECEEDILCLNQIPKRVNVRPTPGSPPDLDTAWGMHLEEGLDIERIVIVVLVGFVSSLAFGIVWATVKKSVQDGFSVAGYIAACETLLLATGQLFISLGTI